MENKLAELNVYVKRAQCALRGYLPPDSRKSASDTISELLGILDSRELVRLQREIADSTALFGAASD